MIGRWSMTAGWICRLLLGAIFIYAALLKIGAAQEFADAIASYRLVPEFIINPLALSLPLFELACGLLLITGLWCGAGLVGTINLLLTFLVALLSALLRGHPAACGCFGPISAFDTNPGIGIARDSLLLLAAVYAYARHLQRQKETHISAE